MNVKMNVVLLLLLCTCFLSVQARSAAKFKDFDSKQLLFDYEDCLLIFQRTGKDFNSTKRYAYLNSCILFLEKLHGKIVPLETIEKVLQSKLNPVDNSEFFGNCVVDYPNERSNVSATAFMDQFVDKVQNLIENEGWSPHESLVCYELDRALRFMCDVRQQCAKTSEERKQVELVYVVGYSLFQLVLGTNKKLSCSSFTSHEDGLWTGQLSDAVWSDKSFEMESQLFENQGYCPQLTFRRIYHKKISDDGMNADENMQENRHQKILYLLTKL